jgi:hypothetical protein
LLRDARRLSGVDDALTAEIWASGWLGQAWLNRPDTREVDPAHLDDALLGIVSALVAIPATDALLQRPREVLSPVSTEPDHTRPGHHRR